MPRSSTLDHFALDEHLDSHSESLDEGNSRKIVVSIVHKIPKLLKILFHASYIKTNSGKGFVF